MFGQKPIDFLKDLVSVQDETDFKLSGQTWHMEPTFGASNSQANGYSFYNVDQHQEVTTMETNPDQVLHIVLNGKPLDEQEDKISFEG